MLATKQGCWILHYFNAQFVKVKLQNIKKCKAVVTFGPLTFTFLHLDLRLISFIL